MKKLLALFTALFTILVFTFSFTTGCTAQARYGAGVDHRNGAPSATPQYNLRPSLIALDTQTQELWVNNKRYGWWLLASPNERYVRAFAKYNFANGQFITWAQVEAQAKIYAASPPSVMNGIYIVRFESIGNGALDSATINMSSVPNWTGASNLVIYTNDMLSLRYIRGALISVLPFKDKNISQFKILNDSIARLRAEIDSLKSPANFWTLKGNDIGDNDFIGSKNDKDFIVKTNNIQRAIFQKDGNNGFGVSNATAKVDAGSMRNRGVFYDRFNNAGELGQTLKSLVLGTAWVFDFKALHLLHTAADDIVQVGKSKDFLTFYYFEKLYSITLSTTSVSFTGTTNVRFFYYNASGQEVTLSLIALPSGSSTVHTVLNTSVNFTTLRMEVLNTSGDVRGLTATINFLDTQ